MYSLTCEVCGKGFESVARHAKACSDECRKKRFNEYQRNRRRALLEAMTEEERMEQERQRKRYQYAVIERNRDRIRESTRRYQAKRMGLEGDEVERFARGERFRKTCAYCGKEFATNYERRKTCSSECMRGFEKLYKKRYNLRTDDVSKGVYHRRLNAERMGLEGEEAERYARGERYRKTCPVCGKEFSTNHGRFVVCSKACAAVRTSWLRRKNGSEPKGSEV